MSAYEFWVYADPLLWSELQLAMGNTSTDPTGIPISSSTLPPQADQFTSAIVSPTEDTSVNSASFPLLNNMPEIIKRVVGTYHTVDPNLWSLITSRYSLAELTVVRERFQEWEDNYYPDFWVGGSWDIETGQPIGGMGSPWFMAPTELYDLLAVDGIIVEPFRVTGMPKRIFV